MGVSKSVWAFYDGVTTFTTGGNLMTLKEVKAIAKKMNLRVTNGKKAAYIQLHNQF